jgi:repressor LexA
MTKSPRNLPNQPLPLSVREKEVLQFIELFIQTQGIAPSYQEIKQNFGFASFNSVQRYLKQLQSKHYLHIPGDNQKRAIQLLYTSDSYSNLLRMNSVKPNNRSLPNSEKGALSNKDVSPQRKESLSLPLLGRVAAGAPIEAFLTEEFVDVPPSLIRYPSKTFGLTVQGESMIEAGIFDGDLIFIQKQSYANNGDTVVATIDNQATVKRFYLQSKDSARFKEEVVHRYPQSAPHNEDSPTKATSSGSIVELRPANSQMKSIWLEPNQVAIQGILVALLRRF